MKETSTKESNSSSIQSRFLLSLALVTTAVVLLFSVVYISVLANVMKQDLNVEAERLVALSTKSLSSALWQYNKEYVNDYLDSLMLREQVVKVEVTTEDSTYTRESTKYKTAKRDMRLISSQSKIFHQKMEVGTIRLFLSAEPIAQRVKYLSAGAISFFMAIILMTSITVYWLTNKLLFAPLAELQETFKLISKGNLDAPISTARNDEIGQLAKEFKKMIDSINALTASRDELNHEIEERKRAETLLIQTEKLRAIGTLAGGIAHDFNNILHAIIGHAELAFDDAESDTEQAESLQEILGASMRARDLVQQILTFARQGEIKLVPVKVSSIASEVFRFIRSSTPTTIEMVNHFESKAKVLGVPTKLHQVLMNLCTNAIQSMEVNGGTLTITTNDVELDDEAAKKLGLAAGDYMRTEVRDTGAGIAQEDLNKVFDPYFTNKPVGKGSGLGLSVVHGIVDDHGGAVNVESELGKGSLFTIYLPVSTLEDEKSEQVVFKEESPTGEGCILLVDDEEIVARTGARILKRLGYTVKTSNRPMDALKIFTEGKEQIDLVITDMTMPEMTGDKLAKEMLSQEADIPIILCTGNNNKIDTVEAEEIGITCFLEKPFTRATIAKAVKQALSKTQ